MTTVPPPPYPATPVTTPSRGRERMTWDRPTVHAILDATPVCHVAYATPDGPLTIPTTFARVGERIVLHASTGAQLARLARAADGRVDVCVTATIVDGWVLARSGMHHSMNYRSVVVRGSARVVTDETARRDALAAILDAVWAERSRHCRPPNARELAATTVLELPLELVAAKVRAEGANDDPEDAGLDHWAGVVPVHTVVGAPIPNHDLRPGIHLEGARMPSARPDPAPTSDGAATNAVTAVPAADPATAREHHARRLALETDCWDVHEALASDDPGFVLLDVRGDGAWAAGHVPGAVHLPHADITAERMAAWPDDTLFVVHCAGPHCNGAQRAAIRLAELGRPVKEMIGGITGWQDEGFDLVTA